MSLENDLAQELDILIEGIIRRSEEAGQRASGQTYQNITREVYTEGSKLIGQVWAPSYFYTLIRGRGPGGVPANMADLIMDWARYKGITFQTEKELLRFANATAWKIRREGSELYRNHLYVDILDTPVEEFEDRFLEKVNTALYKAITQSFRAEGQSNHGFIL